MGNWAKKRKNSRRQMNKTFRRTYLQFLCFWIVGITILAYAPVATYVNSFYDQNLAKVHRTVMERIHKDEQARKKNEHPLESIIEYNKEISGYPIVDPYLSKYKKGNPYYDKYLNVKGASSDIFATITIPKINVDLPIYHGTSDEVLGKGVGHLFGSPLPADGFMSILTGHTGLASRTIFDRIPELSKNDNIVVNINGVNLAYKVREHKIILPTDVDKLQETQIKDGLVLITCYPYAQNTHRYIIFAERVDIPESQINNIISSAFPGMALWLWIVLGLAILFFILGVFVPLIVRKHKTIRLRREGRDVRFWK